MPRELGLIELHTDDLALGLMRPASSRFLLALLVVNALIGSCAGYARVGSIRMMGRAEKRMAKKRAATSKRYFESIGNVENEISRQVEGNAKELRILLQHFKKKGGFF